MKSLSFKKLALTLATLNIASLLSGCGSSPAPAAPAHPTTASTAAPASSCLSIASPIGFTTPQGYMDSINFMAGVIPMNDSYFPGQTFGAVTISAGGTTGPYAAPNSQLTASPDGSISANATPVAAGTAPSGITGTLVAPLGSSYGVGTTAAISGQINISPAKQQIVLNELAAMYPPITPLTTTPGSIAPQPGVTTALSNICPVSVAVSLHHNGFNLYAGRAYIYFVTNSMNMTLLGTSGPTINPSAITGAALYNLPKIVLKW